MLPEVARIKIWVLAEWDAIHSQHTNQRDKYFFSKAEKGDVFNVATLGGNSVAPSSLTHTQDHLQAPDSIVRLNRKLKGPITKELCSSCSPAHD